MSDLPRTAEYRKGDTSQRLCGAFFMRRGWYVIPSYDYHAGDTKAPRMQGESASFILPDLDVAKAACRRWVEVKYKRAASFTYKTKRLEHGMESRLFRDYLRVEAETGSELWLAIHEGITEKLIARRVSDLLPFAREWGADTPGAKRGYARPMTYFPRCEFQFLTTIPLPEPEQGVADLRGFVAAFPDLIRQHLAGKKPVLFPNEQALLFRYPDDVLTLAADLDLLPWFGPI